MATAPANTNEITAGEKPRSDSWIVWTIIAIGLWTFVLIYPAYLAASRAATRQRQMEAFGEVLDGLSNYDRNHRRLPDAVKLDDLGEALYSWRLGLMVFLVAIKDGVDLHAPWTSDSQRVRDVPVSYYCTSRKLSRQKSCEPLVSSVIGRGTPFQDQGSMVLKDVPCDTILIIEAQKFCKHWMAPGDLRWQELDASFLQGTDGDGVLVGFADGEIWMLSPEVPLEALKKFFIAQDPPRRDRRTELAPFRMWSGRARSLRCEYEGRANNKEGR